VPLLVEAGHEVVGMTRSPEKVDALRAAGVEPAVCDALDREGVRAAVTAARPEAVVHQLTDLPRALDPRDFEGSFAANNRLRIEGTRNLVDAARAAGARRLVAQSIAFVYAPRGGAIKSEEDALDLDASQPRVRTVQAVAALETSVTETEGIDGLVLRYGYFYGPGTAYAHDGHIADLVRRRRFPIVGRGSGIFSFVHVDDAARAAVLALERGAPGVYNVVDDEPAQAADWLPVYADALGAPPPRRVPRLLARIVAGEYVVLMMTEQRGASNAKAKSELGWEPRYPTWRSGFREGLG
jgi:nucleoside-diphosphate-sugar epimerase